MNKKLQQTLETKRRITDAAKTLIFNKGYKATSIEDIVEASGSSKGNIYYHFKSKEGLFLHIIEEWDEEWEQRWKEKEHLYPTATDKLYGMFDQLALDELNHPISKAIDEFVNSEDLAEDVKSKMAEIFASHFAFNKELLQQGIAAGEFAPGDAETLSVVLESLLAGLSQTTRVVNIEDVQRLYHDAVTVFLRGITPR
ncbi:TetR family transcriptional regulator [Paenibacillus oralis]|uniref:TetR family transcriptional regulator n=1 Tax=Paenibacillus oralis TaxID=2490856 RepID=A0A3P3U445_9BACL|nr:TetR/AcrR family transcriptional regulator [Paenibacillus oralis]RRJ65005.1 TetR family transcriptional regulator [Paenibacillus oralis]